MLFLRARVLIVLPLLLLSWGCTTESDPPSTEAPPAQRVGTSGALERGPGLSAPRGAAVAVFGTDLYEVPSPGMPEKGGWMREPVFGTPIVRLTSRESGEYQGPGIQNEYSRVDPENADGTVALLRGNEGDWYACALGGDFALTPLDEVFADCEADPEPRWDSEDPDVFYFACGPQLRRYDIASGDVEVLHDFSEDVPDAWAIQMRSEGDASRDRRYWAEVVYNEEFEVLAIVVYDLQTDEVVGRLDAGDLADELDWIGMDVTGEHVLVGWESLDALSVYSRDLTDRMDLPDGSNAHGDEALTADGRSVWVYQNVATDYISMADLETGRETALLPIPFDVNADIGLHISGNCVETPGWVLVSTYGARQPADGDSRSWMDTQLFMLELRESAQVRRVAFTQCYTAEHAEDDPEYFFEAYAAVNAAGSHVYWGSNWGRLDPQYTDAYVAVLPDGWAED